MYILPSFFSTTHSSSTFSKMAHRHTRSPSCLPYPGNTQGPPPQSYTSPCLSSRNYHHLPLVLWPRTLGNNPLLESTVNSLPLLELCLSPCCPRANCLHVHCPPHTAPFSDPVKLAVNNVTIGSSDSQFTVHITLIFPLCNYTPP